jgi:hypothetical protein
MPPATASATAEMANVMRFDNIRFLLGIRYTQL